MTRPLFFALFSLVACGTDTTKDTGTTSPPTDGTEPTPPEECNATITAISPDDGAVVSVGTDVVVTFDVPIDPDDDYALVVTDATGKVELATDGLSMTWTGVLAPDTTYTVSASVCADERQSSFSTPPDPVDLTSLPGKTYVLPWPTIDIVEPTKGDLLDLNIDYLLAQIVTVNVATSSATAVGTMGIGENSKGDVLADPLPECATVSEGQVADFTDNPLFTISGEIQFVVAPTTGDTATLEDFVLEGVMVDGGNTIRNPNLTGLLATETLGLLKGLDCFDPFVQLFGATCLPCTSSPNGYCMYIEANAPEAAWNPNVDIVATCAL